jgi:hypothetical protein
MNDQSYRITFFSRANLYCFLFLTFPTLLKNEILHQQLWGYKVEWRSVYRGTGGGKVDYHWCIVHRRRNRRHRRFRALASTFRLIWIALLHIVVKRVRNSTARFRCAFCNRDVPVYDYARTSILIIRIFPCMFGYLRLLFGMFGCK